MSLIPALTGVAGVLPLPGTAPTPAVGELVNAENVQEAVQALLNQDATLERTLRDGTRPINVGVIDAVTAAVSGDLDVAGLTTLFDVATSSTKGVQLAGAQPAKTADPGANNIAIGTNQIKAWAFITVDTNVVTYHDGMNFASFSIPIGAELDLVFARPMANTNYSVCFGSETFVPSIVPRVNTKTTADFSINLVNSTNGSAVDLSAGGPYSFSVQVVGRQ